LLMIILFNCCSKNNQQTGPINYDIKIIDDYTNSPLAGCIVNLETFSSSGFADSTYLGLTNSVGEFQYQFSADHSNGNSYSLFFNLSGYYLGGMVLNQNHNNTNCTVRLIKKNVLRVFVKRITSYGNPSTASNYVLLSFNHIIAYDGPIIYDGPYSLDTDTLNKEYHGSVFVPSNKSVTIFFYSHHWDNIHGNVDSTWQPINIVSNYYDSTFYHIQY